MNVIHDGDHGGDDFLTTIALLMRPKSFQLLGVTTVHGNISAKLAANNALKACHLVGRDDLNVYSGAEGPIAGATPAGDGAFGDNGIGNAQFPEPDKHPHLGQAIHWLIETLSASPQPVTIFATGPLSNIAELLTARPDVISKISCLYIMGGALRAPSGNITPSAEFNFYMDPVAADTVLAIPELRRVVLTLDATHGFVFGGEVKEEIFSKIKSKYADQICKLMMAAEEIDGKKFGVDGTFLHDVHTVSACIHPSYYEVEEVGLRVVSDSGSDRGSLRLDKMRPATKIITRLRNPDGFRRFLVDSLYSVP